VFETAMGKTLLFLACLVVPGLWGLILNVVFVRCWPKSWSKAPPPAEESVDSHTTSDVAIPPSAWDYQI